MDYKNIADRLSYEALLALRKSLERDIVNVDSTLKELKLKLEEVDIRINNYHKQNPEVLMEMFGVEEYLNYQKLWTWKEKIIYIFKHHGNMLNTKEIASYLYKYEPKMRLQSRTNSSKISSVLSSLVKEEIVEKQKTYDNQGSPRLIYKLIK